MIPALFGTGESVVSSTSVSTEKQDGTSKGLAGRLGSEEEEDVQAPSNPRGGQAVLCLGLHLYFPLVLLYQCQHGKLGAKTGAALLDYNKKSCQG